MVALAINAELNGIELVAVAARRAGDKLRLGWRVALTLLNGTRHAGAAARRALPSAAQAWGRAQRLLQYSGDSVFVGRGQPDLRADFPRVAPRAGDGGGRRRA